MSKAVVTIAFFVFSVTPICAQQPRIVKWDVVQQLLSQRSDTTYVVNFWATWCKPCVAEIPSFQKIHQHYAQQKIRVVLVSVDFAKEFRTRVVPFAQKMNIESLVLLLNEPDANAWINKIDPGWSGAVPATLIFNNRLGRRTFSESLLTYADIEQKITEISR